MDKQQFLERRRLGTILRRLLLAGVLATEFFTPERTVAADLATNASASAFAPNAGLRMNFRGVPLEQVLDYLSKAAGFVVHPTQGVDLKAGVDVWSDQPLTRDEAVTLLKQVLNENGYTVIQNDRLLTIIPTTDARKNNLPVETATTAAKIPRNAEVVTEIIPVRDLNPSQLLQNLQPLLASENSMLSVNESAHALMMTDTHANIKRMTEIIEALDSVGSSINTIRVLPLKFADAKTIAGLIKDLFPTADSSTGSTANNNAGGPPGFGGGGPPGFGGADGGNGGGSSVQTPHATVTVVSEDHGNLVIVSAPEAVVTTIEHLVKSLDFAVQDTTELRMFHLKNADVTEMSDLLATLYPDDNNSGGTSTGAQPFGGPGGPFGMMAATTGTAGKSEHMKKLGRVATVADARTSSLVVTAAKELMPQIAKIIADLDASPAHKQRTYVVALKTVQPYEMLQVLSDVIPAGSTSKGSAASASQNDVLATRLQTITQQWNSKAASGQSSFSSQSTGGSGGSGGGTSN